MASVVWTHPGVPGVGFGRQHAPVCGAHVVFVHMLPGPRHTPPCPVHTICVATTHEPSGRQHAPEGCGHAVDEQSVPLPP